MNHLISTNTTEDPNDVDEAADFTYPAHANGTSVQAPVGLLDKETREPIEKAIYVVILALALVGIATNIINIRVFIEQGLKESINVCFLSLSVFDFLGCLTLVPISVCYIIWMVNGEALFRTCMSLTYIPSTYPHAMFSKVSNWITVYISVERCLCVILPLRVKQFFTPKIAILAVVMIVLCFLSYHIPYASFTRVVWKIDPALNETVAFTRELPTAKAILKITSAFVSILTFCGMALVFVATGLMMARLVQIKKWRQKNSKATVKETTKSPMAGDAQKPANSLPQKMESSKETEMIKSVLVVTTVFLVCLSISRVPSVVIATIPGSSIRGFNKNIFMLSFSIRFLSDAINSAVNFFFYIRISSRYKQAFVSASRKTSEKLGTWMSELRLGLSKPFLNTRARHD